MVPNPSKNKDQYTDIFYNVCHVSAVLMLFNTGYVFITAIFCINPVIEGLYMLPDFSVVFNAYTWLYKLVYD